MYLALFDCNADEDEELEFFLGYPLCGKGGQGEAAAAETRRSVENFKGTFCLGFERIKEIVFLSSSFMAGIGVGRGTEAGGGREGEEALTGTGGEVRAGGRGDVAIRPGWGGKREAATGRGRVAVAAVGMGMAGGGRGAGVGGVGRAAAASLLCVLGESKGEGASISHFST